ncbi:BTAD domain-containing putative transcriptional regulator [Streptomyces sp. NPDC048566]|uniref:AfsR/SARP family transcriptional regulator n=1 Tax=Streptomyces sp. NPDC048566 TaxID=3365569 RepID=UPI003722B40C
MEIHLLGSLEMADEYISLKIPGEKLRAIVATLALTPNRPVSRNDLIDELWGENPPRHAENSLHGHMARLRRIIAARTGMGTHRALIGTSTFGYVLSIPEHRVDALRFCDLVRRAALLQESDPAGAVRLLTEGLALWRGPALLDAGHGMLCRMASTRFTETRLTAWEQLFDAQFVLGMHRSAVTELEQLHAQYPLRERFCEQLITALYRTGRQAEALDAYHRTRQRLSQGLGLEPGHALRARFQEILRQEPLGSR